MPNKFSIKKVTSNLFNIYKEDGEIVFVIFGIKIKLKSPTINRLEELCIIPDLRELLAKNTKFPHPIGIVINGNVKLGNNCTIYQNVTIGDGMSANFNGSYPTIGNNVIIFANAVVIGKITVGDNAVIGAGSIVTKDVPQNAVVVGNPAKVIREKAKV